MKKKIEDLLSYCKDTLGVYGATDVQVGDYNIRLLSATCPYITKRTGTLFEVESFSPSGATVPLTELGNLDTIIAEMDVYIRENLINHLKATLRANTEREIQVLTERLNKLKM